MRSLILPGHSTNLVQRDKYILYNEGFKVLPPNLFEATRDTYTITPIATAVVTLVVNDLLQ